MQFRPTTKAAAAAIIILLAAFVCSEAFGASVREKLAGLKTREFKDYVIDVQDKPFGDIALELQRHSGLNILPDQFKDVKITLKIDYGMPWQDAFEIILKKLNADINIINENTVEIVPSTRLVIEKADLRTAIFSLARGSGKNVIIDPDVAGEITLTLEGVPFDEALSAIAEAGGYKVVKETDNLYRVASPSKLITQLITKRITLKYIWPDAPYRAAMDSKVAIGPNSTERYDSFAPEHQPEANFTVLKALKKMLTVDPADSSKYIGQIEYIPDTNTLVIRDVKPKVDEIAAMLKEIDRAPYQIMFDVKFVTTTNTDFFEFGVDFARGITATATGASSFIRFPFSNGKSWFTDKLGAFDQGVDGSMSGGAGLGSGSYRGLFVDPDQGGTADRLPYTFGTLDFSKLQATLRLLKSDQGTEIMQRPQIITLNNKEATIFVGNRVRFAQTVAASNQQGGLTFAIEEAVSSPVDTGFQLLILPRVIEGDIDANGRKQPDRIMMTVIPESRSLVGTTSEIPGFNKFITGDGAGGTLSIDLPEIATSSLVTNMMLKSNETAVVGGLVVDTDSETIRQVPFFSRIPLLGYLMKSKQHNVIKTNLLIFITPRIVYSDSDIEEILARELHRNRQNLPHKYPEEANGHRTFDIERVYDTLYGRPNPYDAWREYDSMPKAGAKEEEPVQPTEPDENYTPENKWNNRAWDRKWNNNQKDPTTEETTPSTSQKENGATQETGTKDINGWPSGSPAVPQPNTAPAATEESNPANNNPVPEKEQDESSTTTPQDRPTDKENYGQLEEDSAQGDGTDAGPDNGTEG